MTPYPAILQHRMSRLHGHLYFQPGALLFLCAARGGAWGQAIGQGVGGAVGGAIAAAMQPTAGAAPEVADEPMLRAAMQAREGSVALAPTSIKLIKYSLWTGRAIVGVERTYGFPRGLAADAVAAMGAWARAHGVATKGKALQG